MKPIENMNLIKKISVETQLYRYDVIQPPTEGWSNDYKSPIYEYEHGPKNEIGAFYFFDSRNVSIEVGKNVIDKKKELIKENNPELSLWITSTRNFEELIMLDLSHCSDVIDLYISLWNEGIDVFRDDFYKFSRFSTSKLSQIREDVEYLSRHKESSSDKTLTCKCNISNLFHEYEEKDKLGYASQGLTDFCNGKIFKDLLEERGLEGYIFRETDANTYCLFNSEKLSQPIAFTYTY